ncbi:protein unc-93 homolog A isoform X2 [Zootermopsis nevadensis]|uniref:protein unc-93 homolog A isoform X2 n=1 Tax=Zootermopsis nevadensis TaxID=136037 RepID=UPI000B8E46D0|nr:protein unc-93 homolog A isoform X2 [Zootermopsis nevadensis]
MGSLPDLHALSAADRAPISRLFELPRPVIRHHSGRTHHQHRVVHQTQSGGTCWDDFRLEHSPVSTRSLSSSGGASSVRRLIAVVRSTPSHLGPIYSRRVLLRNFAALCLGHVTLTAALMPLLATQAAVSSDMGALLLAALHAMASLSSLVAPVLVQHVGCNWTLILGYVHACMFFGLHLYPTPYTLVPAYLVFGLWLGPLVSARLTFLMTLASKLSYVVTEEGEEESSCRRETVVRRLARGLQTAQDFGLVLGNGVTAFLLWYAQQDDAEFPQPELDALFLTDGSQERVCGSKACPFTSTIAEPPEEANSTVSEAQLVFVLPCKTSAMLASVFLGCSVMGLAVTAAFLDRIRMFAYQDRPTGMAAVRAVFSVFSDPRLQLAAPLAVFIGLEQGFMLTDFSKSYVVCTLGLRNVSLVFLSLGALQSLAAFTLSMMLRHIPRCIVIVGFVFHACLLLVLLLWKPSGDDPALFYVIPAAWGVCNAIWEILNFTLLVTVYPDSWQAPLAHCYFFRFLGLSLAFGLHGGVCNWLKLYALAAALVLAVAPYTWLEMRLESHRKLKTRITTL